MTRVIYTGYPCLDFIGPVSPGSLIQLIGPDQVAAAGAMLNQMPNSIWVSRIPATKCFTLIDSIPKGCHTVILSEPQAQNHREIVILVTELVIRDYLVVLASPRLEKEMADLDESLGADLVLYCEDQFFEIQANTVLGVPHTIFPWSEP